MANPFDQFDQPQEANPFDQFGAAQDAPMQPQEEGGLASAVADAGLEAMAAINRGIVDIADFLTTDQINAILEVSGSEKRVPSIESVLQPAVQGEFLGPGLARDVIRTAGETVAPGVGTAQIFKTAATQIPRTVSGIEAAGQTLLRAAGSGTAGQEAVLSAASGAGAEIGREVGGETGAAIGSVLAPTAASTAVGLTNIVKGGANSIRALLGSVDGLSDDGASKLLAEAMVRENLSPDDVIRQMQELGPDAVPADVGNNFSRLLRAASNEVPRIEGSAAEVLNARQAGQGPRILSALDDATGTSSLTAADEIERLNQITGPQINQLYDAARSKNIDFGPKVSKLLTGESSVAKAMEKSQQRLIDREAAGDTIGNLDVIDATKQELDDQIGVAIRQGENNKARNLVRLKNIMVDEVDKAVPEYKQARDLFAGKAALESAADTGAQFFKLKARELGDITKTMGQSEMKMFKLGAKDAILDKIDTLQPGSDAVKRLFGKNGDVRKLKALFDTPEDFKRFSDTLEREAVFTITRRAAQANSTTAKQLADVGNAKEVIQGAVDFSANPLGSMERLGRIFGGLVSRKGSQAHTKALEDVGDILLSKNMNPEKLQKMLIRGNADEIDRVFRAAIKDDVAKAPTATVTGAALEAQRENPQEN